MHAQKIDNVRFEVADPNINIYYDIVNAKPNQDFYITAFCSTDGGINYGKPLNSVNGDIGFSVKAGKGKKIVWDVLNDMEQLKSDRVMFKIKAMVKESGGNITEQTITDKTVPIKALTKEEEKFLKLDDMNRFKDIALQKTEALSNYIITITDKSLENDTKMMAVDQAVRLFQSEDNTVEVSSLGSTNITAIPIRQYLNKIRVLKYSKIVITWFDINYVSEFKQGADGKYYAVITIFQKFEGYRDGKLAYSDISQKQMQVILDSMDKKIGDQVIKQWDVLLGNISVVETR